MQLPNRNQAYIESAKLEYLLTNPTKEGWFKALGFHKENVFILERGLLTIARTQSVVEAEDTPYGTLYAVEGYLDTPTRGLWPIRTIWEIRAETSRPRFVTARPPKRGRD